MGRSLPDLVGIVTELESGNIGFESIAEKIDTISANGKLTFHVFAALAEFERNDRRVSRIVIALASGLELAFSPKHTQGLENAHPADLLDAEITPSGLGIHFPRLDADIYLPALLEGFLGSKRWMAAEIGKIGGATATAAKAAAARENGRLGGRPKKPKGSSADRRA